MNSKNVHFQNVRAEAIDAGLRNYMRRTYGYMTQGLFITAASALLSTKLLPALLSSSLLFMIVLFAPIALCFMIASNKYSASTTRALFYTNAALHGISLSTIFVVYTATSIASAFFITASIFLAMTIYGYATDADLSGWGSTLFMILIGVLVASIVNMFLRSGAFNLLLNVVCVALFSAMTAYDTQILKREYITNDGKGDRDLLAVRGALQIYLDFINLFVHLLHLVGVRRD